MLQVGRGEYVGSQTLLTYASPVAFSVVALGLMSTELAEVDLQIIKFAGETWARCCSRL